jgi:hypothetical protein
MWRLAANAQCSQLKIKTIFGPWQRRRGTGPNRDGPAHAAVHKNGAWNTGHFQLIRTPGAMGSPAGAPA